VIVLVFANCGLLSFFLSGVYYVVEGWDQTAAWCVLGYLCCGAALAVPSLTFSSSKEDTEIEDESTKTPEYERMREDEASRMWWRVAAGALNVAGLVLGITGSLMYSPAFIAFVTDEFGLYIDADEFERVTDKANVIWAVSFVLFPVGSGLFLLDRKKTLDARADAFHRPRRGYFAQELYLYTWIEIALSIFAVGGLFFCFDENSYSLVLSLVLFFIGGGIKAGLMFHELMKHFGTKCDEPRAVIYSSSDEYSDEHSPLLGRSRSGSGDVVSETSSLLGDPEDR
jgi:hypothetical protein